MDLAYKNIMTRMDRDDLFEEAMDEFRDYKLYLIHLEAFGADDPYIIDEKKRFESADFRARLKDFLNLAAKINAAITTVSI
jgi:ATP-dependent RNA circularization protein (DNA/RNA ligase family)